MECLVSKLPSTVGLITHDTFYDFEFLPRTIMILYPGLLNNLCWLTYIF